MSTLICRIALCLSSTVYMLISSSPAIAQIQADTTLPRQERSRLEQNRIEGGAVRGSNLFHSFQEFNVPQGRVINFTNPMGVENILTRVTGSNNSQINGTLGVLGSANLFLINPNGITFGENARLNLSGSFIASTANSVSFSNGDIFSATNPQVPSNALRIAVPLGLQFGDLGGNIQIESNDLLGFRDPNGEVGSQVNQSFAFIGGELTVERAEISTRGGHIELGSVANNATVELTENRRGFSFRYPREVEFRDIEISNSSLIIAEAPDGDINMQGRRIDIDNDSQVFSTTNTRDATSGGDVRLEASERVRVRDDALLASRVASNSRGNGGNLTIITRDLEVRDGGQVSTSTFGFGDGGNLTIQATERVLVEQSQFTQQVFLLVRNEDGTVSLQLISGYRSGLFTRSGQVGNGPESPATGDAGVLRIDTEELQVVRSTIDTSTFEEGNPGRIFINASESVLLDNSSIFSRVVDESQSIVDGADVGNITITTGTLTLRNASLISLNNERNSGRAGNLLITTQFLIASPVQNSDITSNASGQGTGGSITILAEQIFGIEERSRLTDGSDITAFSEAGEVDGEVFLITSNIDPTQNLTELSIELQDPNNLISQQCQPGSRLATNQFRLNGISQNLGSFFIQHQHTTTSSNSFHYPELTEAQGFIRISENTIALRSRVPRPVPYSTLLRPSICAD